MEYGGYNDERADQGPELELPQESNATQADDQQAQGVQSPENTQLGNTEQFDPTGWQLNYKGQSVFPKDREHLINLAQQGWSYTQSMEELNNQRREIDQLKNQYGQYKELDAAMKEHPELQQKISQVYLEHQSGAQQPQDDQGYQDPRYNEVQKKLTEMEQWRAEQENKAADQALDESINKLKEKYPDQPWDKDTGDGTLKQQLIAHAIKNDLTNIEVAYKDLMWDSMHANAQSAALKQHKEQKQKDFNNGIIDGTGNTLPSQQNTEIKYNPGDDYSDISRKAEAMLR